MDYAMACFYGPLCICGLEVDANSLVVWLESLKTAIRRRMWAGWQRLTASLRLEGWGETLMLDGEDAFARRWRLISLRLQLVGSDGSHIFLLISVNQLRSRTSDQRPDASYINAWRHPYTPLVTKACPGLHPLTQRTQRSQRTREST